jgi:hypothetical protein
MKRVKSTEGKDEEARMKDEGGRMKEENEGRKVEGGSRVRRGEAASKLHPSSFILALPLRLF